VQASYLITFRDDARVANSHRRRNLESVLAWLAALPNRSEIEVVIVEQSVVPTLSAENDELFENVRLVHAFNPGPFNKSWGLNLAARYAQTAWLFLADADLILPAGLEETLDLLARGVQLVKPYTRLLDLTEAETFALDEGVLPAALADPNAGAAARTALGEHVVIGGGVFALQSGIFARLGGFDERFLGWGGEDDAMSLKIQRLRPSMVQLDALAMHLYHPRSLPNLQSHEHYANNLRLLAPYRDLPEVAVNRLFEIQRQAAGNLRKYSPQTLLNTNGSSAR
jgi:GT2 family glycosyltransferase